MQPKEQAKTAPRLPAARRAAELEYAIRDVVLPARKIEAQGHQVLKLNIGDPGPFDFPVPEHMVQALHDAAREGYNGYGPSEGDPELRQAIAQRETKRTGKSTTSEQVHVGTGVTEVLQMLLGATLRPGDEILIPDPAYSPYEGLARYFDATPVGYKTDEDDGWQPDVDAIRKAITPQTRAICLINPNNPTGALYSEKRLKQIADVAAEHEDQLFLISDEIYDEMTLDGQHAPTAKIAKDQAVVALNGFSKVHLVTGWRMGYAVFHDPQDRLDDILDGFMRTARNRLCPSSIAQRAALAALTGPQDHVRHTMDKIRKRRDIIVKGLNEVPGISCARPEGAFYAFPRIDPLADGTKTPWKDDKAFVLDLLEKQHVLTVHGSGFGKTHGKDHFRIVFLPQEDVLEEAMNRLGRFMQESGTV
jgi:alanine-synthesizing transaminase